MRTFLITLPLFLIFALDAPAQNYKALESQPIYSCGEPVPGVLSVQPAAGVCDVYSRQFKYRQESLRFSRLLEERQKRFVAPSIAARNQYRKDLEALNASRGASAD